MIYPPCTLTERDGIDGYCHECLRYHTGHHVKWALGTDAESQEKRRVWRLNRTVPINRERCIHLGEYLNSDEVNQYRTELLAGRIPCKTCEGNVPGGIPAQHCHNEIAGPFTYIGKCCTCNHYAYQVNAELLPVEDAPAVGSGWEDAPDVWARFNKMTSREMMRLKAEPLDIGSGEGIVIAGGGKYFPSAYANIRLIRYHGCQLPIEMWYLGRDGEMPEVWRKIVEPYGVRCVDADEVNKLKPIRRLNGWELKMFAAAHSRFRKFIFLDSDCFPMRDPSFVFNDPNFLEFGASFQRDCAGYSYIKESVLHLLGIPHQKVWDLESGAFVVDKKRWNLAMGMTLYLNSYSDLVYKVVYGDKTTPAIASLLTGQKYAIPSYIPTSFDWGLMQRWHDGTDMWQHRIHLKPSLKEELFVNTPQHKSPKIIRGIMEGSAWGPEITSFLKELRGMI